MQEKLLQPDFVLGNMTKDLMELVFQYCNKKEDGKPRFPKLLQRYSDMIIETSISIQKEICIANAIHTEDRERRLHSDVAKGNLVHLSVLIEIAYTNGWISSKQFEKWLNLCVNTYWKLIHWMNIGLC